MDRQSHWQIRCLTILSISAIKKHLKSLCSLYNNTSYYFSFSFFYFILFVCSSELTQREWHTGSIVRSLSVRTSLTTCLVMFPTLRHNKRTSNSVFLICPDNFVQNKFVLSFASFVLRQDKFRSCPGTNMEVDKTNLSRRIRNTLIHNWLCV